VTSLLLCWLPQVKKWMANKRVRCFNTLSITGNKHPIKVKLAGKKKSVANSNTYKQLSDQSKKSLSDWYEQHIYHPYPTETEKDQLASLAGITKGVLKQRTRLLAIHFLTCGDDRLVMSISSWISSSVGYGYCT
jgi:hypothetical protein